MRDDSFSFEVYYFQKLLNCLLCSVSNKPAQCPVVMAHCAAVQTQHPQSLCSSLSEVLGFCQSVSSYSLAAEPSK